MSEAAGVSGRVVRVIRESESIPQDRPISVQTRLLKGGLGLDSVAVLELVIALEQEFGCEIDDDEMAPRWFATVGAVVELIESKQPSGRA